MTLLKFSFLLLLTVVASAQTPSSKEVENAYPDAHALYLDLHEHPELSGHETQTAAKLAEHLHRAGYDVTEHVGGTSVGATQLRAQHDGGAGAVREDGEHDGA